MSNQEIPLNGTTRKHDQNSTKSAKNQQDRPSHAHEESPTPLHTGDGPGALSDGHRPSRAQILIPQLDQLLHALEAVPFYNAGMQPPDGESSHQGRLAASVTDHNVFRRVGATWQICYSGVLFEVTNSKGIQYLALLVHHRGYIFSAFALRILIHREIPHCQLTTAELTQDHLAIASGESVDDVSDKKARRNYEKEAQRLRDQLEDAQTFGHLDEIERIEEQMDAMRKAVQKDRGLGGKSRTTSTAQKCAANSVPREIRRAIRNHICPRCPALAEHLARSLEPMGRRITYEPPADTPRWD